MAVHPLYHTSEAHETGFHCERFTQSGFLLSVPSAAAGAEGEEAGSPARGGRRRGDLQEVPHHAAHGIHPARHAAVGRQSGRHGQQARGTRDGAEAVKMGFESVASHHNLHVSSYILS